MGGVFRAVKNIFSGGDDYDDVIEAQQRQNEILRQQAEQQRKDIEQQRVTASEQAKVNQQNINDQAASTDANVVSGGDSDSIQKKRKKNQNTGLAGSLGINI